MNTAQRTKLMAQLWPNAADANGWRVGDREKRLDVINHILESHPSAAGRRVIQSASELDAHDDFTHVKAGLMALAGHLQGAEESGNMAPNGIRTRRFKVLEQIKCLALYPIRTPMGRAGAQAYAHEVIGDLCNQAGFEPGPFQEATFTRLLYSLDFDQVHRLVKALDRALHNKKSGYRVKAGDSIHAMRTGAGLKCFCKECCLRRGPRAERVAIPVGADDDNEPF